jgi:hypothetical protein
MIEGVTYNDVGQLVVRVRGREGPVSEAKVARCFPWSMPDFYIALRDKEGKELALLKSLDELDAESRAVVERELRDKVFTPRIRRVIEHREEFGVTSITVDTDRGQVTFQIRSRDDVRALSDRRAIFRDADGNAYELADLNGLDAASRKCLQEYL